MTVNLASSSLASTYNTQSAFSTAKLSGTQNSSGAQGSSGTQNMSNAQSTAASSSSDTELTKEEQKYDADGDGVLSATEKAAMLEAQAKEKAAKSEKPAKPPESESATVEISQEAYQMYRQNSGTVA